MSDPLSISASIVAVLQLTATVVRYLNDMKDATNERQRIVSEISSAHDLLSMLKTLADRSEWGDPRLTTMKSLTAPQGPLEQLKLSLEKLEKLLKPSGRIGNAIKWPFQRPEVLKIVAAIERQKSLFTLALHTGHM